MALSDLASIAIIVQGMFFLVSLALVWYQLQENTKLVRAANTQKLVELSVPFNLRLAQDRALMELWWQATQRFDQLDEIDKARYFNLLTWWLTLHENIYHQWKKGLMDEDIYGAWTRDLKRFLTTRDITRFRSMWSDTFEVTFIEHIDELIAENKRQQAQKQRKLCASEKPGPAATSTNS